MDYAGMLLIATPSLVDPHFDHTVVLVLSGGADGSVGVILNRATEIPVPSILPAWSSLVAPPGALFEGGPVQPDAAICVGQPKAGAIATVSATRGVVHPSVVTVDLDGDVATAEAELARIRVFSGYAGWGPGQLEAEVSAGGWLLAPLRPGDAFTADPDALWQAVLRRQGGLTAAVARYPSDPSLN